jgi:phosphatidylglycerophosphate synthase
MSKSEKDDIYKLDNNEEGMLDVILRPSATVMADFAENNSISPNNVTIFRSILALIGVYCLYKGDLEIWFILYLINYFLDCVDGIQARKYKRTSKLGDILDHVSDITIMTLSLIILVKCYGLLTTVPLLIGTAVIFFLFIIQIARQQVKCNHDKNKKGVLDKVSAAAKIPIPNCVTKNTSAALVAIWTASLPYLLNCYNK